MFEKFFGPTFQKKYALSEQGAKNVSKGVVWTVVVNLLTAASMGFLYLLFNDYLNTLVNNAPLPAAMPYIVALVVFLVISFAAHRMQYHNTYGTVYSEVGKVRVGIGERLRKLPLSFFGGRDLADLAETIMSDVDRLEHVWSHVLGYLYGSYISTAIFAIGMLFIDWRLTLAAFWGVPVAFGLLFGLHGATTKASVAARKANLAVADGLQEMLDDVREIRATNQEERYLNGLFSKVDTAEKATIAGELRVGLIVNAASVIMRLGVATTILAGALLIASGEANFLTYYMFLLVITRIYAPFDQALALIAELFVSEVSAERLQAIFDETTAEGSETFEPAGYDICFDGVGFAYKDEAVLRDVSFTAREGEVTALVGPSGSGKSTCARLAARLWDHSAGSLTVGGIEVNDVDPETLMSAFSMVFQDVTLFDDTVTENIRLGRSGATDEEVLAAAAAANCDEFVNKLPQGYATPIGENGSKLSGGERQRISIARALLKDAPILLMDEATASLDVENETRVQEALSRLIADKTVLVIAHRMRTVTGADHVVVLDGGRVIEDGVPAELLVREGSMFAHMAELQNASTGWVI